MRVGGAVAAIAMWTASVAAAPRPTATVAPAPPSSAPPPAFGRVIYRAARVGGFEQTGVTMIACRHRDPVRRRFAVQFFDRAGRAVASFGATTSPPTPAGRKVLFVTDGTPFRRRGDVLNVRLGHLSLGTARVVSDARVVRCVGKMRMDGGLRTPSYREEIGLVRAGAPPPELPATWKAPPYAAPRR